MSCMICESEILAENSDFCYSMHSAPPLRVAVGVLPYSLILKNSNVTEKLELCGYPTMKYV